MVYINKTITKFQLQIATVLFLFFLPSKNNNTITPRTRTQHDTIPFSNTYQTWLSVLCGAKTHLSSLAHSVLVFLFIFTYILFLKIILRDTFLFPLLLLIYLSQFIFSHFGYMHIKFSLCTYLYISEYLTQLRKSSVKI